MPADLREELTFLAGGFFAAWDLAGLFWMPVLGALALVVAHGRGGRAALWFGLPTPAGTVVGLAILGALGMDDRAWPTYLLASGYLPRIGGLSSGGVLLAGAIWGLLAARRGATIPRWGLALGGTLFGAGLVFVPSPGATLFLIIDPTGQVGLPMVVFAAALMGIGTVPGPIPLGGFLAATLVERCPPWPRLARARSALWWVAGALGLATAAFAI